MTEKNVPTVESRAIRRKRMIAEMSNARTFMFIGIAFVVHAAVILGTSIPYMRTHWFGAKAPEEKIAQDDGKASPPAASASAAAPAAASPSAPAPSIGPTAGLSDDDKKMAERSSSPIVKSVTEAAKPGELPKGPSANPLDLNDKP
jgi:hypothetical protein